MIYVIAFWKFTLSLKTRFIQVGIELERVTSEQQERGYLRFDPRNLKPCNPS